MVKMMWLVAVLLLAALITLWSWPNRQEQERVSSGLRAAELGAKLSFAENLHKEKFGAYTRDFSRLGAVLGEAMPCPLEQAHTVLACPDYHYTVTGGTLIARRKADPEIYVTFGLASGEVDCSHALPDLQREPICSAFE